MDATTISPRADTVHRDNLPDLAGDRKKLLWMECWVAIFGFGLVILSMAGYFINTTCKQISELISKQNDAAAKLGLSINYYSYIGNNNFPIPPSLLLDVIEFSRRNATLLYTVNQISEVDRHTPFLLNQVADLKSTDGDAHFRFTKGFTLNPDIHTISDLLTAGVYQIRLYQAIRDHAQAASDDWNKVIEVGTAYLLPIFYAVLGAFLFMFRSWSREHRHNNVNPRWNEIRRKTTNPHWPDHISRLLMAGIAGIAIGALNELFPKEILLSPLALAFLVGYSIEIFTSRLDDMINKLKKGQEERPVHAQHAD